jgi:hypothetical protein
VYATELEVGFDLDGDGLVGAPPAPPASDPPPDPLTLP